MTNRELYEEMLKLAQEDPALVEKLADTIPEGMLNLGDGNFTDISSFVTETNGAAAQAGLIGGAALGTGATVAALHHARKARIEKFLSGKVKGMAIKFAEAEEPDLEKEAGAIKEIIDSTKNYIKAPAFQSHFEQAGYGKAYDHFKDLASGEVKSKIGKKVTQQNLDNELLNLGMKRGSQNYKSAIDAMKTKYNTVDPMQEAGYFDYVKSRVGGAKPDSNMPNYGTLRSRAKVSDGFNPTDAGNMSPGERVMTAPLRHPVATVGTLGATIGGAYMLDKKLKEDNYNDITM